MSEAASLVLELRNDLAELTRLSDAVDAFCAEHGLPPTLAFKLNLALEEVVANVINHAFPDPGHYCIHVRLTRAAGCVCGEVCDTGKAFDPLLLAPPRRDLDIAQRAVGGLGVHLLKTLMDEVTYTRENGQNHLQFVKNIESGAIR